MSLISNLDKKPAMGPMPIVIGVTGHRDLVCEDIPLIEESLQQLFRSLREIYPHTPLRILSPLAEGSDRTVAKLALKWGAELVIPLPMSEQEYRRDFEATVADFDDLKRQASMVFVVPLPAEAQGKDIGQYGPARDACYESVGIYIAKHAHVLIALWNGYPSTERGGTAQIAEYCMHDSPHMMSSVHANPDPFRARVIWHLPVHRSKKMQETFGKDLQPYQAIWRFGEDPDLHPIPFSSSLDAWPHERLPHLRSMDIFNRDALLLAPEAMHEILHELMPQDVNCAQIDPSERIVHVFMAADLVASKHQKETYQLWKWIFILAGLMVISFESYANLWAHVPLLIVYPAAFVTITILYWIIRKRRLNDRFIDARSLAEGLRIQIYWRMAGLRESVTNVYLRRHTAVVGWVLKALRGLNTLPGPDTGFAERLGIHLADQFWVQGQLNYYDRQSTRQTHLVKTHERLASFLYMLALVFSVCVVILSFVIKTPPLVQAILILLMASGPAIAVLWIAYAEKQGWDKHVKEYRRTLDFFMHAHKRLREMESKDPTTSFRHMQEIILDLGKEALYENAEWVVLHRQRPPTIPMG